MCGFIGTVSFQEINFEKLKECNKKIECRGPDNLSEFKDSYKNINLAGIFNRLSILDLSELANQPMYSEDKNYILFFNGEIYNHKEIKNQLKNKNYFFKTNHSDTESLLYSLVEFASDAPSQLRGQFAFAFINKKEKKLLLCRDRLGQKPLYYTIDKNSVSFSSNLISLSSFKSEYSISNNSLIEYLNYGKVLKNKTIFDNLFEVEPGEIIEISFDSNIQLKKSKYWNLKQFYDNIPFNLDEFDSIFNDSVELRTQSDVPYATFLSGGLDSTAIVQSQINNDKDVNTFSVYMENSKFDEKLYCERVAKFYNTNHTSIKIKPLLNIENVENIISSLDQPLSDPSYIPTFILSKEISKYYKMAISGDGGDELLAGYKRVQNSIKKYPKYPFINTLYKTYPAFLGTGNFLMSKSFSFSERYDSFLSDNKLLNLLGLENFNPILNQFNMIELEDNYKQAMLNEYNFYLSQLMMLKVDRASMANSIEVRSPFVDHKLIEYIFSHNYDYYQPNLPKALIGRRLIQDFDLDFIKRKKQGFTFDLESFVYKNEKYFNENINHLIKNLNIDIKNIRKLFVVRTRMNANRVWKLYVLSRYLINNL